MSKKNFFIFCVAFFFFAATLISAYFFAQKKNEPTYSTEIDKIIFDTKNKPPKFLLTLPDQKMLEEVKKKVIPTKKQQKEIIGAFEILRNIPTLARLPKVKYFEPLKHIEKIEGGSWIDYSKEVKIPQNFYQVAVVIKSFGLNKKTMGQMFEILPENISLSFSPYAHDIEESVKIARERGHETYVDLLLESKDVLRADHGPLALSITSTVEENVNKLKDIVNKDIAIGGFVTSRGIADASTVNRLSNVTDFISENKLLFIDSSGDVAFDLIQTSNLAREKANIIIDTNFERDFIKEELRRAEAIAMETGHVIIIIDPKPVVLIEVINWANTFSKPLQNTKGQEEKQPKKPFVLAPLSDVVIE